MFNTGYTDLRKTTRRIMTSFTAHHQMSSLCLDHFRDLLHFFAQLKLETNSFTLGFFERLGQQRLGGANKIILKKQQLLKV